ncbi:hypothetical protein [Prosthecobacter sp.]|uniref:hypothetical protein n=1 Tax=Prosthecobacter sp. TaxID=1965333 RepID=UPI0025FE756F|nr:hypothetical protein [Prosthecobacter sp.]
MSFADIAAQASMLPLAERVELTRYLTALETEDELRCFYPSACAPWMPGTRFLWRHSNRGMRSSKSLGCKNQHCLSVKDAIFEPSFAVYEL